MNEDQTKDEPTIITCNDIDMVVKRLLNGDYDPKQETCLKCGKGFWPNYNSLKCDTCYFSQFPKEDVKEFYKSFFE